MDCAHLVEPLSSLEMKLEHWQYLGVTWQKNVLQVTTNTGERFQHFNVRRRLAVEFVRNPGEALVKGYRFERVRGSTPQTEPVPFAR